MSEDIEENTSSDTSESGVEQPVHMTRAATEDPLNSEKAEHAREIAKAAAKNRQKTKNTYVYGTPPEDFEKRIKPAVLGETPPPINGEKWSEDPMVNALAHDMLNHFRVCLSESSDALEKYEKARENAYQILQTKGLDPHSDIAVAARAVVNREVLGLVRKLKSAITRFTNDVSGQAPIEYEDNRAGQNAPEKSLRKAFSSAHHQQFNRNPGSRFPMTWGTRKYGAALKKVESSENHLKEAMVYLEGDKKGKALQEFIIAKTKRDEAIKLLPDNHQAIEYLGFLIPDDDSHNPVEHMKKTLSHLRAQDDAQNEPEGYTPA